MTRALSVHHRAGQSSHIPLEVQDIGFGGKGVSRHESKVVFVPFTIPGEKITASISRAKKNFAEADLISVELASPDRVDPECPYFQRCGGCAYQHIAYPRQLKIKQSQVEQTLRRIGRLAEVPMRAIIPSEKTYAYRNRIRVHAADGTIGFYAASSQELIDIEFCPIATAQVNARLRELRAKPVRDGDYSLARDNARFFEQVNDGVAQAMIELIESLVRRSQTLLVDAYCGAGFFAKQLAPLFERVVGIEENALAVECAQRAAGVNEQYIAGDVAVHLDHVLAGASSEKTTLILDPPAIGISSRVSDAIFSKPPAELIYVSCNPATLARDLQILCRIYALDSVTPLDMFPQTAEIEVVAHLVRQ